MPTPKTLWRQAGDALLADGQWHDYEEVIQVMMPLVPSGMAVRHRRKVVERLHPNASRQERSIDMEAAIGSRNIANKTIVNAVKYKTWERDGRSLRLRPKDVNS